MAGVLSNKIKKDELKAGDHIYSWRLAYLYSHHGIYTGDGKVIHFTRRAGQEIGTGTVLDRYIFSSSSFQTSNSPCPQCGDQSNLDGVICSCLECFLSGGDLYRFEYSVSPFFFLAKARGGTCTLALSDPPKDVLNRAEILLENGFGDYSIFKNNCEDFAIYCKTGLLVSANISVGRSGQANSFMSAATAAVSPSLRFLKNISVGRSVQANSFMSAATAVVSPSLRFFTTSFGGLAVGCGVYCVNRYRSDIGVRCDVTKIPVEMLVVVAQAPLVEAEPESVSEIAKEVIIGDDQYL